MRPQSQGLRCSAKKNKELSVKNLVGKKIVVTAGRLREDIDGVRHYANHRRLESQGYAVASKLAVQGADVTVIAPKNTLVPPAGCRLIQQLADGLPLLSGQDLMQAVDSFVSKNSCDAVLCFASLASVRPAERAEHKKKMKSVEDAPVSLTVVGNVDVEKRARRWGVPVLGYNSWQEIFSASPIPKWLSKGMGAALDRRVAAYPITPLEAGEDFFEDAGQNLKHKKVILTSGPTEELLTTTGDVITNFSSGRQGYELALAFAHTGAKVIYVVGPTSFPPPLHKHIQVVRTTSAKSMLAACEAHLPADIFVGVAAVADFGCKKPFSLELAEKQKYDLVLNQNPDILRTMGHHPEKRPEVVVGFAAETDPEKILDYAKGKLASKNADLICANLVGRKRGHGGSENQIMFVPRGGEPRSLALMSKRKTAFAIVQEIAAHFPVANKAITKPFRDPSDLAHT
jgi:phosphopantothenoylcysteine synthetase/decarboxylase